MSAGLSLLGNLEPQAPTTDPLTSLPSSAGERMGAAWDATQTPDRYWNITAARRDKAQKVIDDYHALTGEKLRNPFDNAPTVDEVRENMGQPTTVIYAKRLQTLREKTQAARAGLPDLGGLPQDFLNVDDIDPQIGQESGARRARDERLTGTGNGIPAFVASTAGEMFSPHGIASMFLPVTRVPLVAAEMQGGRWLANVGKEALLQGASQAAVQAIGAVVDYNTRKPLGTEQTPEQIAEEIASAGVGGAVFGGGFRAAHLGIRSLMNHGAAMPPAVRDAAIAVESSTLYGNKNPLGVPAAAHEEAVDRAVQSVAFGRPVSVGDLPNAIVPMQARSIFEEPLPNLEPKPVEPHAALPEGTEIKVYPNPDREAGGFTVQLEGAGATEENPHYRISVDGDGEVLEAFNESRKFSGLGSVLYEEAIRAAEEQGLTLSSAGASESAQRVWRGLEERGLARSTGPGLFEAVPRQPEIPPEVQRLQKWAETPTEGDLPSKTTSPPAEEQMPKAGGETASPQDKSMDAQVRELIAEGGAAPRYQKEAMEKLAQEEKEARIATACVGGGAL